MNRKNQAKTHFGLRCTESIALVMNCRLRDWLSSYWDVLNRFSLFSTHLALASLTMKRVWHMYTRASTISIAILIGFILFFYMHTFVVICYQKYIFLKLTRALQSIFSHSVLIRRASDSIGIYFSLQVLMRKLVFRLKIQSIYRL